MTLFDSSHHTTFWDKREKAGREAIRFPFGLQSIPALVIPALIIPALVVRTPGGAGDRLPAGYAAVASG
ncbi:hypothetical protein [Cohnella sp. 56]|uniref:hypothetical protein n=1 Tax=Cohnella sp. 56 TaxID=3113722 RepID=UPI0030E94CFD